MKNKSKLRKETIHKKDDRKSCGHLPCQGACGGAECIDDFGYTIICDGKSSASPCKAPPITQCEDGNPDCFHTTEPVGDLGKECVNCKRWQVCSCRCHCENPGNIDEGFKHCIHGCEHCSSPPEPVEEWEKRLDEELGFFLCTCREEPCPRSKRVKTFINSLLAQERERQKRKDAAKVWLWHKEHCDCEETPLGFDTWHENAEALRNSILNPKDSEV